MAGDGAGMPADPFPLPERCPVCGNPGWHDRSAWAECTHCGLMVRAGMGMAAIAAAVRAALASGRIERAGTIAAGWQADPAALRTIAWAHGYRIVAADQDAASVAPAVPCGHHVTLAIMARGQDADAVAEQIGVLADGFARIAVLLDGDAGDAARLRGLAPAVSEVAWHPLAGDFGAQRNRLQALAGAGWVLQLDSDERPTPALVAALGWLTAAADGDGLRSLGLPRRNLVDGRLSALYPDIQYRLNRADVRFAGCVHERPVVPFADTSLALCGAIDHRLSADRVRARTRLYGGMATDGARPQDERALLRAYDGPPMACW